MNFITLTNENLEKEHICCAISNNKDCQVASKKAWLSQRLEEGLVFTKGDVRGKVFMEYIPAEKAWVPIEAEGYMFIHCFWVSGQYKGQGISNELLVSCITDSKAKGKKGLAVISSKKKLPYLSDGSFLRHKGFQLADTSAPYYELLYLPFEETATKPSFKVCAKKAEIKEKGWVLYYSQQCPFTAKYVPLIEEIAKKRGVDFQVFRYESAQEAQNAPVASTTYSLFYEGQLVTHEILSDKKFIKILESKGL